MFLFLVVAVVCLVGRLFVCLVAAVVIVAGVVVAVVVAVSLM